MAAFTSRNNGKVTATIRRVGHASISRTFPTRQQAQDWASAIEAKTVFADPVTGIASDSRRSVSRETIGDLLQRYGEEVSVEKKSVVTEQIRIDRLRHRDPMGELRLCDLDTPYLFAFKKRRMKQAPRACALDLQLIRHMLKVARREWGVVTPEPNPFSDFDMPPPPKARVARVSVDMVHCILTAAGKRKNRYIVPVILFAYFSGMRRSEILSARWDNYDAVGRTLLLTDTKNGTERLVPITRTASKIIDDLPRGTDRIFNIVEANFSTTWTRIVNAAGEQGLHFHDFRHEAISHFFDQGLSTAQVREISGHKTLSQLSRYTHLDAKKIASQIGGM